jgi:hypothetical protein
MRHVGSSKRKAGLPEIFEEIFEMGCQQESDGHRAGKPADKSSQKTRS